MGILAYLVLGETNIGRQRIARMQEVLASLPDLSRVPGSDAVTLRPLIPERHQPLFKVGQFIGGFEPVGGNQARVMPDFNATIEAILTDINAATNHVHLLFYIWLPDNNGRKVIEAMKRAAARGSLSCIG